MPQDVPSKWVLDKLAINAWIASQGGGSAWPGSYEAIGLSKDGEIVAGLVFYDTNGHNCFVNIAVTDTSVLRKLLRLGFGYVFSQLKLHRLTFVISCDNLRSIELVIRLGAVHEATLREAGKEKEDLHIFALFRESCPMWRRFSGQISTSSGSS